MFSLSGMTNTQNLSQAATKQMRCLQNNFPVLGFRVQSQQNYCRIIQTDGEHASTMEASQHNMVRVIKKPKKLFSEIIIGFDEIDGISWTESNSIPSCQIKPTNDHECHPITKQFFNSESCE